MLRMLRTRPHASQHWVFTLVRFIATQSNTIFFSKIVRDVLASVLVGRTDLQQDSKDTLWHRSVRLMMQCADAMLYMWLTAGWHAVAAGETIHETKTAR